MNSRVESQGSRKSSSLALQRITHVSRGKRRNLAAFLYGFNGNNNFTKACWHNYVLIYFFACIYFSLM